MSEEEIYRLYFSPGSRFEKWNILQEIGFGATGKVFLAFMGCNSKDGSYAALKVFPANCICIPFFEEFMKKEYKILANLDGHVNIVKVLPQDRHSLWKGGVQIFYLTLEYCPGDTLEQFRRQYPQQIMPPTDVFLCLEQIVRGVQYAHEKHVIHGDICAENILLMRPNNLKVTDFGLARITKDSSKILGKRLYYQAPEAIEFGRISTATDIWALGILTYRLLTATFPYSGDNEIELRQNICSSQLIWPDFLRNSQSKTLDSLVYLIERMLTLAPQKRPSSRDLALVFQRCHNLLDSESVQKFDTRFLAHIEKMDRRPQEQIPQDITPVPISITEGLALAPKRSAGTDAENNSKQHEGMQHEGIWDAAPKGLSTILHADIYSHMWAVVCIIFLAMGSFYLYRQYSTWLTSPQPPFLKQVAVVLKVVPASQPISEFFTLTITMADKSGSPMTSYEIERSSLNVSLNYRSNNKFQGRIQLPRKTIFMPYLWELPQECSDSKLYLWIEVYQRDHLYAKSDVIPIDIEEICRDRMQFQQAIAAERQFNQESQCEKIAEAFENYIQSNPHGIFREQAFAKLRDYSERAASYHYENLRAFLKERPEQIAQIITMCEAFVQKYKTTTHRAQVIKIKAAHETLITAHQYEITLIKAHCHTMVERADSYVKVYVNGNLFFTSSIVYNDNTPEWNQSFKIFWKSGDTIKVELWDKNPRLWADKLHLRVVDNSQFSIRLLTNRISPADNKNWLIFSSNFPLDFYPEAARKFFHR